MYGSGSSRGRSTRHTRGGSSGDGGGGVERSDVEELDELDFEESDEVCIYESSGSVPLLDEQERMALDDITDSGRQEKQMSALHTAALLLTLLSLLSVAAPHHYTDIYWLPGTPQHYDQLTLLSRWVFYITSALTLLFHPLAPNNRRVLYTSGAVGCALYIVATFFRPQNFQWPSLSIMLVGVVIQAVLYPLLLVTVTLQLYSLTYHYTLTHHSLRELDGYTVVICSAREASMYVGLFLRAAFYLIVFSTGHQDGHQAIHTSKACGVDFCYDKSIFSPLSKEHPTENLTGNVHSPTEKDEWSHLVQAVFGFFLSLVLLATLLYFVYTPRLHSSADSYVPTQNSSLGLKLSSHLKGIMRFLIPTYLAIGINQAYVFIVITNAFLTCSFSVYSWVFYTMMTMGGAALLTIVGIVTLYRYNSRVKAIVVAWFMQVLLTVFITFYSESSSTEKHPTATSNDDATTATPAIITTTVLPVWLSVVLPALLVAANVLMEIHVSAFSLTEPNKSQPHTVCSSYIFMFLGQSLVILLFSYTCVYVIVILTVIMNFLSITCYLGVDISTRLNAGKSTLSGEGALELGGRRSSGEELHGFVIVDSDHTPSWIPQLDPHKHGRRSSISYLLK